MMMNMPARHGSGPRAGPPDPLFSGNWLNLRHLAYSVLFVGGLIGINKFGTPGNVLCYAVLLGMAVRNTGGALAALLLSSVVVMGGGGPFVVFDVHGSLLKFALLVAVAARILFTAAKLAPHALQRQPLQWLVGFALVATALAFVNNYYIHIVLLKLVSFTVGVFAMLTAGQAWYVDRIRLAHWVLAVSIVVAALSFATIVLGLEHTRIERTDAEHYAFTGMFGHPQATGVISTMLAVLWITFVAMQTDPRARRIILILVAGFVTLAFLSGTRTGLIGMFLALGIGYQLIAAAGRGIRFRRVARFVRQGFVYGLLILPVLGTLEVVGITEFSPSIRSFLMKDDAVDTDSSLNIVTLFEDSRGTLMERNWNQFMKNPLTGVGFGVDTGRHWRRTAGMFSAPTERGFWPYAVLAEVGIIGAVFVAGFFTTLVTFLLRRQNYVGLLMVILMLVLNLGEMSMFAFGGLGMMSWALIACAMVLAGNPKPQRRRILR